MTTYYSISCPKCGRQIDKVSGKIPLTYGDPHSTCPHCGATFVNSWVVELALLPKEWYVKNHRKEWVLPLLYSLAIAIPILTIRLALKESIWICYASLVLCIIAIGYAIYYKSKTTQISVKETGFERKYEESEKRLSNQEYKQHLIDSGYYQTIMANIKK